MTDSLQAVPPPRPPARRDTKPLPGWAFALGLAATTLPLIELVFVVPQFDDVFRNFGAELPWIARVLVAGPWAGLAWTALVALDGWRARRRGGTVGFVLRAGLGSFFFFVLIIAAMYWPIFRLAATP